MTPETAGTPECPECGSEDTFYVETNADGNEIFECDSCESSFEVLGTDDAEDDEAE